MLGSYTKKLKNQLIKYIFVEKLIKPKKCKILIIPINGKKIIERTVKQQNVSRAEIIYSVCTNGSG